FLGGAGGDRGRLERTLTEAGAHPDVVGPTIDRNGTDVERIARLMTENPELAQPLSDHRSSLADAVHAVRHEGAAQVSDVTLRRTHLAWFTADHSRADAERIADVMAAELGWTPTQRREALDAHERELVAEAL
ncbi:MAG: glycerol-3-phosphate dehydrogenase C-terminal domain-containing protein, partial [Acidimicrobiia bacterium]